MDYIFNIRAQYSDNLNTLKTQYATTKKSIERDIIKVKAILDPSSLTVKQIQEQLNNQKVTVTVGDVKFDSVGLEQVKEQAQQSAKSIDSVSQSLNNAKQSVSGLSEQYSKLYNLIEQINDANGKITFKTTVGATRDDKGQITYGKTIYDKDTLEEIRARMNDIANSFKVFGQVSTKEIHDSDQQLKGFILTLKDGKTELANLKYAFEDISKGAFNDNYTGSTHGTASVTSGFSLTSYSIDENAIKRTNEYAKAVEKSRKEVDSLISSLTKLMSDLHGQKDPLTGLNYTSSVNKDSGLVEVLKGSLGIGLDYNSLSSDIQSKVDAYRQAYTKLIELLTAYQQRVADNKPVYESEIQEVNKYKTTLETLGAEIKKLTSSGASMSAKSVGTQKVIFGEELTKFEDEVKKSNLASDEFIKKIQEVKTNMANVGDANQFKSAFEDFRKLQAEFSKTQGANKNQAYFTQFNNDLEVAKNKLAELKEKFKETDQSKLTFDFSDLDKVFDNIKTKYDLSAFNKMLSQTNSECKEIGRIITSEITNKSKFDQLKNDFTDLNNKIKELGLGWNEIRDIIGTDKTRSIQSSARELGTYMSKESLNTEELKRAKAIYDSIKSSIDQVVEAKKKSSQTEAFNFDKDRALQNLSEIKKQMQELGTDESQLTYKTEDLETAFANITDKNSLGTFNKMLSQATKEIQEQVRSANELANSQAKQTRLGVDFTNASKNFDDLQRKIRDLNIDESTLTYTTADLVAAYDKISDSTSLGTFNAMLSQATKEVVNQEREINKSNKSLQDQEKEWQRLTDLINKAYGEATNSNTNGKAIQDPATIKLLRDQYDAVVVAVNEVRNATTDTFDQSKKSAEQAIQAFIEYSKVLQNSEQSIQATDNAIKKLQTDTQKGLFAQNSGNSEVVQLQQDITNLSNQYAQLQARFQNEGAAQEVIAGFTQLDNQIKSTSERAKELQSSLKSAKDAAALEDRKSNLNNKIETWLRNNTRASESMRQSMKSLQTQIQSADKQTLTHLTQQFNELNRTAQQTGQIGKSALDIFKEKASKFAGWFGLANAFMWITNEGKQAVVTLKDVDSILTEISKTSERSAESLEKLGETAFDAASKYGVSVQNYLTGVQEMARAGYEIYGEERSAELAELALLIQSAGDTTAQAAQEAIIATDAAFQLGGNVEELTKVFNSLNKITNNTAINMNEMAIGIKEAASIAHQYGVSIEDTASLIAIAEARTKQGGAQVGNAIKSLLVTLTDITNSTVTKAFDAVGVSMYKFVDGSKQLKTPIELLGELSKVFNELPQGDDRRSILLNDIGGMQIYHYVQKCA